MVVGKQRVFVVEDDESLRPAIERLLTTAGFGVAGFTSAEAMLGDASHRGAGCIVTDLKLPGMSGFELIEDLQRHGVAAPVILITAHDAPGLHAEAARRGAAAYLAKPFLGTALLEAIRAVMVSGRP
ncbi:response regulator [Thiorhodococcus mannitoliphagus]|uniref:Response regulator n=1 Tax=Thiorhodococcus mannitoliphagus TaxID=329406 RepID=A0A6P1DWU7_9GAMM|nr:response regulator [Thiorhodococcus mannitoliphagus]NEX21930.1 response regulator [Thiorhodococcus mannitoliphagus]